MGAILLGAALAIWALTTLVEVRVTRLHEETRAEMAERR